MKKIRIAVAEDNSKLARSISETLSAFENVELLFIAVNGQEMIHKVSADVPDLILMDINMPVLDGIGATKKIRHLFPQVRIVMLTIFDETEKIFDAILAGATGYLLKDEKPEKLLAAIEEAMEGGAPMSASIAAKALQLIRGKNERTDEAKKFNLSERETQILELIAKGENYNQIAEKLFISPKTVRKHIENIYSKLQVHNKVEAIQVATKNKLFSFFF